MLAIIQWQHAPFDFLQVIIYAFVTYSIQILILTKYGVLTDLEK